MSEVGYWMGRPVEELTREELLEVVQYMSRELERYRTPKMRNAIVIGKVAQVTGGRIPESVLKGRL
jgi:hypothetical protein